MPEILSEMEKRMAILNGADRKSPEDKLKVMIAVNQSNFDQGYPHASYSSGHAFDWALHTIKTTNQKSHFKLLLIHVKSPQSWISFFRSRIYAVYFKVKMDKPHGDEEELAGFEEIFNRKLRHEDEIEYEWVRKTGRNPAKVICNEVKELRPDVLVLGNRGLTYIQRLFRPNVSECCAKKARCDVIRVKRGEELLRRVQDIWDD